MNSEMYFLIGAIVGIIVMIAIKKSTKVNYSYDERQILIRGRAYKIGFTTMLVFAVFYMLLSIAQEDLLEYGYIWNAISLFGGLTIFAIYSIWNDAFFSLQQNPRRYLLLCLVVTLCNCMWVPEVVKGKITLMDLVFSYKFINVLCALTFIIISITIVIKIYADRKEED